MSLSCIGRLVVSSIAHSCNRLCAQMSTFHAEGSALPSSPSPPLLVASPTCHRLAQCTRRERLLRSSPLRVQCTPLPARTRSSRGPRRGEPSPFAHRDGGDVSAAAALGGLRLAVQCFECLPVSRSVVSVPSRGVTSVREARALTHSTTSTARDVAHERVLGPAALRNGSTGGAPTDSRGRTC